MKKLVVIIIVMLVAVKCTNNAKQSDKSNVQIKQQLIDSARVKIEKAGILFVNAKGNVDSLNKVNNLYDEAIAINPKDVNSYIIKFNF